MLLDENKAEVGRRLYNAYGETVQETGSWPEVVEFAYQSNWLKLTTLPDGLPLYLSPTRLYDAGIGAFLARDPLGTWSSINAYKHSSGVLQNTDPLGLESRSDEIPHVSIQRGTGNPQTFRRHMRDRLRRALTSNNPDECRLGVLDWMRRMVSAAGREYQIHLSESVAMANEQLAADLRVELLETYQNIGIVTVVTIGSGWGIEAVHLVHTAAQASAISAGSGLNAAVRAAQSADDIYSASRAYAIAQGTANTLRSMAQMAQCVPIAHAAAQAATATLSAESDVEALNATMAGVSNVLGLPLSDLVDVMTVANEAIIAASGLIAEAANLPGARGAERLFESRVRRTNEIAGQMLERCECNRGNAIVPA